MANDFIFISIYFELKSNVFENEKKGHESLLMERATKWEAERNFKNLTKSGAASLNELHAWFVGGAGVGRKVSLAGPVRLVNRNLLPLSKRDGKETHITNLDRPMMEKSVATAQLIHRHCQLEHISLFRSLINLLKFVNLSVPDRSLRSGMIFEI